MKDNHPIDTRKMFFIPLTVLILATSFIGLILFTVTEKRFKSEMIESGTILSETLSQSICDSLTYRDNFLALLDERLVSAGHYVLANRTSITNDYLFETAEMFGLTDIYWYNSDGLLLFDANDEYVGWTPTPGDPIDTFMHSGQDLLIEDIRKSTDDDRYYKFVYLRDDDGYFVQLGIKADVIESLTNQYDFQYIIENYVENNQDLLYALVINLDFVSVADTDLTDIGIDYSGDEAYTLALNGVTNGSDWYYDKIGKVVLEIATPIYHNDEIIGILGIGYSYDDYRALRSFLIMIMIALILIILVMYTFLQYIGIINPLKKFSEEIEMVDIEHIQTMNLDVKKRSNLAGIKTIFARLVNKVYDKEKENEAIIRQMTDLAFTDQLTQLPNRLASKNHLTRLCQKGNSIAVMYIDIDDFKSINDTRGHYYGDALIKVIAARLASLDIDDLYISRYQGDEFIVIYSYDEEASLINTIKEIKHLFTLPITIDQSSLYVEFSMGISRYPQDGYDADELLQKADIAMYEAKKEDKMTHMFFDQVMTESLLKRNEILAILNHAILNDGFYIVYQPQIHIDSLEIVGLEALLRIKDSYISPYEFIPIAEQNRLINKMGRIVIDKVLQQQALWHQSGLRIVPVFVNFSANQLQDYTIKQYIHDQIEYYHVPPDKFGVEVTESTVIDNRDLTIQTLHGLKSLGIKTAIDDFGSGQAGINYMTNFKVDIVKFDKSFSDKYLTEESMEIYHTILKLTHDLGFITLVEGIETEHQIQLLRQTDCKLVQGYFYYRPSTVDVVFKLLEKNKT